MPHIPAPISSTRLLRQYLRWLPAQLGLVNRAAYLLQINEVRPSDTFIVSYPKSGNTWVRFIVAYLLNPGSGSFSMQGLENIVPDVYTSKDIIDSQQGPRFIKSHHSLFKYFPRTIYIHRDYRDVLVSYYRYKTVLHEYTGSFSEFIRSNEVQQPFGTWAAHINAALEKKESNKANTLIVSYEKLITDFATEVKKIAAFIGADADIDSLRLSTGFEKLKAKENEAGSWFRNISGQNFFNEGRIGVWKNVFSNKDIDYLQNDKELNRVMSTLNYKWE
jgi:hypothetical protein